MPEGRIAAVVPVVRRRPTRQNQVPVLVDGDGVDVGAAGRQRGIEATLQFSRVHQLAAETHDGGAGRQVRPDEEPLSLDARRPDHDVGVHPHVVRWPRGRVGLGGGHGVGLSGRRGRGPRPVGPLADAPRPAPALVLAPGRRTRRRGTGPGSAPTRGRPTTGRGARLLGTELLGQGSEVDPGPDGPGPVLHPALVAIGARDPLTQGPGHTSRAPRAVALCRAIGCRPRTQLPPKR